MKKWLDKYNDDIPQAQNGIEGTMGGLTDVGFNYNGAWGGTMAMGGGIPGAVGFTYARTGSIPSNGPYAKKTKASAQNGKEMKYYQEGLDFKPKNISQDGLKLLLTQPTGDIESYYPELKKMKEAPKVAETKKAAADRANLERVKSKTTYVKPGPSEAQSRINRQQATELAKQEALQNSPLAQSAGLLTPSGYNPGAGAVGAETFVNMAPVISAIPSSIRLAQFSAGNDPYGFNKENIISFDNALASLGMVGDATNLALPLRIGTKATGKYLSDKTAESIQSGLLSAKNLKEASRYVFQGIPTEKGIPRLSPADLKAYRQVQEISRLGAIGKSQADKMVYALENNLPEEHFQRVFNKTRNEAQDLLNSGFREQEAQARASMRESLMQRINRTSPSDEGDDMMRQLVDATQLADQRAAMRARFRAIDAEDELTTGAATVDRSQRIARALDDTQDVTEGLAEFRRNISEPLPDPEEWITFGDQSALLPQGKIGRLSNIARGLKNSLDKYSLKHLMNRYAQDYPYYTGDVKQKVPSLHLSGSSLKSVSKQVGIAPEGIKSGDVFTGSLNTSHSSYLPQLKQVFKYEKGAPQFLGYKPMNELGFLSNYGYTSDDIARYLNTEIDEQIRRGILPKNIQRPFNYENRMVALPHYGVKEYKEGGVIKDDMGYWNPENWGEPVEINSNEITMEGVYEPLLGISDTGDVQMMYPGEDYTFDGETVTEYPIAKSGASVNNADAQPIEKLDQLLNFTNYNKPTKGGWLDKYQ